MGITVIVLYVFFCIFLIYNWHRISVEDIKDRNFIRKFSIIISVRNEEKSIIKTLISIENQLFDFNLFEVIIINDFSTDATLQQLKDFKSTTRLNLKIAQNIEAGKKSAITLGIEMAQNEIIICTDADCEFSKYWLASYNSFYLKYNPKFVFGAVKFTKSKSIFSNILQLEFATLIGTGAATHQMEMPTMCNGANLSYLKSIFLELNGFENINNQPSGDDVFFMLKVYEKYPNETYFLMDKNNIVSTKSPTNFNEFYHQRLRWASKWGNYKLSKSSIVGVLVLFTYIFILFYVIKFSLFSNNLFEIYIFIFSMIFKFIAELVFVSRIMRFFNEKINLLSFVVLYLFYPFYLVYFAFAGRLVAFEWKNRKYKS